MHLFHSSTVHSVYESRLIQRGGILAGSKNSPACFLNAAKLAAVVSVLEENSEGSYLKHRLWGRPEHTGLLLPVPFWKHLGFFLEGKCLKQFPISPLLC